jgi:hypothetical protein
MKIFRRTSLALVVGLQTLSLPAAHSPASAVNPALEGLTHTLRSYADPESGLPVSHKGDLRLQDWATTYDAAVATMAYLALDDVDAARRIVDFYRSDPNAQRLGGLIEAVKASFPHNPQNGSVRTGANLWMGIAATHLYARTGDRTYLAFAEKIGDFGLRMQDSLAKNPTYGALRLGPRGDDSYDGDQHIEYDPNLPPFDEIFATEVTIDAYALFDMLASASNLPRFRDGRERALQWLKRTGWNREEGRFNRGYFGKPDLTVATDVHAWAVSALGPALLDTFAPNAVDTVVDFVEKHCWVSIEYERDDGTRVPTRGFDFIAQEALAQLRRPPVVSPEWTFQMANAYHRIALDTRDAARARKFEEKRRTAIDGALKMAEKADDGLVLPYASLPDVPIGHEFNTPYAGNKSLIGVVYGILAIKGVDPLQMPVFLGATAERRTRNPTAVDR